MELSTIRVTTRYAMTREPPKIMEPKGSLPQSQQLFICPYGNPKLSSPQQPIQSFQNPSYNNMII
jgi:hypothetical protein